jgi:hypothetical protein
LYSFIIYIHNFYKYTGAFLLAQKTGFTPFRWRCSLLGFACGGRLTARLQSFARCASYLQ